MRIKEQFNRYAESYGSANHIQKEGAKILVNKLQTKVNSIADLGCGSGSIYKELNKKNIEPNNFYAVDFAPSMLSLHPKNSNIKEIYGDFNTKELFKKLEVLNIDIVVSSSALQWAYDLNFTLNETAKIAKRGAFFIFTSNTFKTLHETIDIDSPIYKQDDILKAFNANYKAQEIEKFTFELEFLTTLEMLQYIKRGGVTGGLNIGYKKMKKLINNYPLKHLEFETLLLIGDSRCQS